MRDPDLIGRAQRAATELERAYDRWRTMHGLSREPMPAVSSYVGYSLEEPWGQPRVVFGIEAREAEQLAALLDRHECNGPVYAGMAAMSGARPEQAQEYLPAAGDRGRVVVPNQAQPTVAEREAAWREATWRNAVPREQESELGPPPGLAASPQGYGLVGPAGQELMDEPTASVEAAQMAAEDADPQEALAAGEAQEKAAIRQQADPVAEAGQQVQENDEVQEDDQDAPDQGADQPGEEADVGKPSTAWSRPGRGRGHVLPKQRRGAARGGAGKQGQE